MEEMRFVVALAVEGGGNTEVERCEAVSVHCNSIYCIRPCDNLTIGSSSLSCIRVPQVHGCDFTTIHYSVYSGIIICPGCHSINSVRKY